MANFVITPALTGYASITQFTLSAIGVTKSNWAIGDGTIASSPTNIYKKTYVQPGIYQVSLLGNDTTLTSAISVRNFLPESISLRTSSITGAAASAVTLIIDVTSNQSGPIDIDLYAKNSYSTPYQFDENLWSHLNANWKFLNDGRIPTSRITVNPTSVYYSSASGITFDSQYPFIGTTASVTAYYYDDLPSSPSGIDVIVTRQFSDTINSNVSAAGLIFLSASPPTSLNVTMDGVSSLNPFYWIGGNIPYVISINATQGILKYFPFNTTSSITAKASILNDTNSDITSSFTFESNTNQIIKKYNDDGYTHAGGYSRNIAKTSTSSLNVKISASASFSINYKTLGQIFFSPLTSVVSYTLTGISSPFDILPLTHNSFRRFNESNNFTCQLRDFVNAPVLKNSENFFVNYLEVLFGGEPIDTEQPGQKIMERISNFSKNHHDVETANLRQFLSLAEQIDLNVEDFGVSYPSRLARVMDVASCPRKKVWGARCPCNENFGCSNCCGDICKVCGKDRTNNLGAQLALSATVNVGTPIVVQYLQYNGTKYDLYHPRTVGALSSYAVSSLSATGDFKIPLTTHYKFYTYIDSPANNQVEGLINWDDEYTTISEAASSENDWYGDNQIIDSLFNLELHRGLNIIDE